MRGAIVMAGIAISRSAVLPALAGVAVLLVVGGVVLRRHRPPAPAPISAPPRPPVVPPLHWTADNLRRLLAAIDGARLEGLRPSDYRRDDVSAAIAAPRTDAATDALATQAAQALARDYSDGHIHKRARFDWHIARAPVAPATLDADLRGAVERGTLEDYLGGLLPTDPRYVALRTALHDTPAGEPQRIAHIRASMERWRWMPRTLGDDYVWVNVPTYRLALMHGQGVVASHVVVVGAAKTPTPMLSARIGSIIVNPWWTLPPTVLAEGKRYSPARGFVTVTIGGKAYVRQKPGPDNALGRLKIDMPNPYAIYLHDTPAKWAFGKPERALSHGCIRVQGIAALAGELTRPDTIAGAMADLTTRTLQMQTGIPVYIVYFTAAPDADGQVVTYGDPYDRDAQLIAALDGDRGYRRADSTVPTKRSSLTPKRNSATNGADAEPERAANPGTNATY